MNLFNLEESSYFRSLGIRHNAIENMSAEHKRESNFLIS